MTEESKAKAKARRDYLYRTKWMPAYLAFIALYPFGLEDLEGEIWRWIADYEGLYQISNYGRVKSFPRYRRHKESKILKPSCDSMGYLKIGLNKDGDSRKFAIHRLVAQAFIPNPNNLPEVNHKDGHPLNCYVENLEWATKSENMQHAIKMGLLKTGTNNVRAKLTAEQVRYIRKMYRPFDRKFGARALARKFNVSLAIVKDVIHGKTYKNVD